MYKEKANQNLVELPLAQIEFNNNTITLSGAWLWSTIDENKIKQLKTQLILNQTHITINGSNITSMDTIGAFFISRIITYFNNHQIIVDKLIIPELAKQFFHRVNDILHKEDELPNIPAKKVSLISQIGCVSLSLYTDISLFISFFGQFFLNCIFFIKSPHQLNWDDLVRTIINAGVRGMLVASLLSFLIGITLAYQMSPQFITYGANIYIVNFLGIALLKEVSPLLTAIIVAGRTGSAITAEIGVMKVQEEIDAIQTMGISPITRLVLPKVIGVMISVPLITAIADMASMFGGAIVANATLGIPYTLFLERMQNYVSINNYTIGIYKSIVFAFLIALIGCYCGFKVQGNANSIGEQTTKSVVLGIILIVFSDAVFAVICKILGV